jgi:ribosomal-protein-alanine N-acetyltransferase
VVALFAEPLQEVVLRGERVYLRPPRRGDYLAWARLREASREFLVPWEPVWPSDALSRSSYRRRLRRILQDWRDDTGYAFHIVHRTGEKLLGGIALSNLRRGVAQSASVGYWIGAEFADQGFMTEALDAILAFGFGDLALHRIEAACLPANEPSRRLLHRLGFQQEGLARQYLRINGQWEDHVLFGLLRDEYR